MAEMVVSREPSRPIQPASGEGRKFSGSNAVAQKATAYHSNGNSKRFQKPGSRGCAKKFAATQATPKQNAATATPRRSEEHTSELQSRLHLVCRLLLEKKKTIPTTNSVDAAHRCLIM